MATAKKLFIPGKTAPPAHQGYKEDMQTLEIFNPINKLIAGSGVTLNPTDGTGPQVEISASGGGSTKGFAVMEVDAGIDASLSAFNFIFPLSPTGQYNTCASQWTLLDSRSGIIEVNPKFPYGNSWFANLDSQPNTSVNFLPNINFPPFGGGNPCTLDAYFWAASMDFTNYALYTINGYNIAPSGSPTSFQFLSTDFTLVANAGADLILVAGSGASGTGIVSASGSIPYLAGFGGSVTVPFSCTFGVFP